MLVVRITTRNPLRVTRKYETKQARLLAITSEQETFSMLYAVNEKKDLE